MFSQRHRLRRIAALVLLAWLFMLTAGIANACVLASEPGHGIAAAGHDGHTAAAAPATHDAHAAGGHDHPSSPQGGKTACAKACNEASTGAQTLKQKIDPFTAIWLAPAPADSLFIVATASAVGTSVAGHDPGPPAIPIRIAFLRLTL